MSATIDPITRSVVQHRLSSIVAEMGEAMLRTSYSQILNSSRDFSLAICDAQSRLIAQADHIPVHVGALPWATRAVEERFKDVVPGDVILMNDPYHGGSHLPDVTVFVPVFDNGRQPREHLVEGAGAVDADDLVPLAVLRDDGQRLRFVLLQPLDDLRGARVVRHAAGRLAARVEPGEQAPRGGDA